MLKIGQKVKIRPGTRYYGLSDKSNPSEIVGEISRMDKMYIHVKWSNGTTNSYSNDDLMVINNEELKEAFNKIINYKPTTETFPVQERIPEELTEGLLSELSNEEIVVLLLRYDKTLKYIEEHLINMNQILKDNLFQIKTMTGLDNSTEPKKTNFIKRTKIEDIPLPDFSSLETSGDKFYYNDEEE